MKKLLLSVLSLFLLIGVTSAQETGKKAQKKAQSAYNSFKVDQTKTDELLVAMEMIESALKDGDIATSTKAWKLKGDIYAAAANKDYSMGLLDPNYQPQYSSAGMKSYEAYDKLFGMAEKKYDTKAALEGMKASAGTISQAGITLYEEQKYEEAYNAFQTVLEIHDKLVKNDAESVLATEDDVNNQVYITGLAALNANDLASAKPLFKRLQEAKFEKPAVYEALYKITLEQDGEEAAMEVLSEGREKFPDDVSLLFSEINYYLKVNKLDILVEKLKSAIEKEPDNVSLYSTMGNVYDNLYQKAIDANDEAKAQEYFDSALSYYNQALERKKDHVDAIYSIGALYFNKAASKTTEMNDLPVREVKKFEALKAEVNDLFDKALPFFKNAEKLNPNDLNTLIALKEIFARKEDFAKSAEFKTRLEKVQAGESNEGSYFEKMGGE